MHAGSLESTREAKELQQRQQQRQQQQKHQQMCTELKKNRTGKSLKTGRRFVSQHVFLVNTEKSSFPNVFKLVGL